VERQGYALSLRKIHDDDWAVGFHQHALRAPEGFSTAATPFVAVHRAAWRTLNHTPTPRRGGADQALAAIDAFQGPDAIAFSKGFSDRGRLKCTTA